MDTTSAGSEAVVVTSVFAAPPGILTEERDVDNAFASNPPLETAVSDAPLVSPPVGKEKANSLVTEPLRVWDIEVDEEEVHGYKGGKDFVDLGVTVVQTTITRGSASRILKDVHTWSVENVQSWLDSAGFRKDVCEIFKVHSIDGPALLSLTDETLATTLNVTSGNLRSTILSVRNRTLMDTSSISAVESTMRIDKDAYPAFWRGFWV
ncbi:hypothetical protein HDU67_008785 [Dinochytrium kinnereticum]|nr:hypothetical protein HDU67_008785 [Dinochytrium kinnereticum]